MMFGKEEVVCAFILLIKRLREDPNVVNLSCIGDCAEVLERLASRAMVLSLAI